MRWLPITATLIITSFLRPAQDPAPDFTIFGILLSFYQNAGSHVHFMKAGLGVDSKEVTFGGDDLWVDFNIAGAGDILVPGRSGEVMQEDFIRFGHSVIIDCFGKFPILFFQEGGQNRQVSRVDVNFTIERKTALFVGGHDADSKIAGQAR